MLIRLTYDRLKCNALTGVRLSANFIDTVYNNNNSVSAQSGSLETQRHMTLGHKGNVLCKVLPFTILMHDVWT